mgnify:CR=1 FL=1
MNEIYIFFEENTVLMHCIKVYITKDDGTFDTLELGKHRSNFDIIAHSSIQKT